MELAELIEKWGNGPVLAVCGATAGVLFGFMAQRSRFCLRAAVLEFWHREFGHKLVVWLLAFSTAVIGVQVLALTGHLDTSQARQIASKGSLSGAVIGGLLFGAGMVLARGCASRLLILSANGNLRALLSGLIFAVTAQSALSGALSPLREQLSSWWTVDGGTARDLLALTGQGHVTGVALGVVWFIAALYFARRSRLTDAWLWVGSIGTGLSVALAWGLTHWVSHGGFEAEVVPVQGLTFSGPSAEWLMRVLTRPAPEIGFDFGLMPAVFLGSLLGALWGRDFKLEGFKDGYTMRRYIAGAILMGFGAMLAGGCAVGAGVTGGAIFALTAWAALLAMWLGAGLTDRWIDGRAAVTTPSPATVLATAP